MTGLAYEPMTARIDIMPRCEDVARRAADLLADALSASLVRQGRGSMALSGGRTPILTLRELSRLEIDWSQVSVTLVDERWVQPDAPDSNQRLITEHFLNGPAARARFVPMKNASFSPLSGMGPFLNSLKSIPTPLDAVLLGMGEDGHFASLFPRSPALREGLDPDSPIRCVAVPKGENGDAPSLPRMSLTLGAIAKARRIVLLTSGVAKLQVLQRAIGAVCNPTELPVSALLAARPDTVILHGVHA